MLMKRSLGRTWRAALGVVMAVPLAACGVGGGSDEAGGDSLYAGENVDFVVPYDPGGGYDVYARLMAPYLEECLDATLVVRNEPGAGGLVATNETAQTDPNEPHLEILNMGGFAASQLAEAEGVEYDLREFTYAGRIASAPDLVATGPDSEFKSFEDVINTSDEVTFVSSGVGSLESISAAVLISAYDLPGEIVTGFTGSDEARAAVTAGDADLHSLVADSHLAAVEAGDVRPLVLISEEPDEMFPDVPLITEYPAKDDESQSVVDSLITLDQLGRTIAGPPGMSEEHAAELREGFQCAMENEELLAEFEEQGRPVVLGDSDQVHQQLDEILENSPPEFVEAVERAFE
jgi:tripartite-type tricarboxylate transporter receptor subunit TctC